MSWQKMKDGTVHPAILRKIKTPSSLGVLGELNILPVTKLKSSKELDI